MAKPLLPSKKPRGPGRAAQRVKPGEVIRGKLVSEAKGASIGDCHRLYTKLKLEDWQNQQKLRLANLEAHILKKIEREVEREVEEELKKRRYQNLTAKDLLKEKSSRISSQIHTRYVDVLKERASQVHPRSSHRQASFLVRKEKATAKIMARKRAPGNVTYENFSKFFHLLKQLGYIAPILEKDFITSKVTKKHEDPKSSKGQIEPPVIYQITDLGQSVHDWNNPKN